MAAAAGIAAPTGLGRVLARAALSGALVGLGLGVLVAGVDVANALRGPIGGSRAELALSVVSLLVLLFPLAGALLGCWLSALVRAAARRGLPVSQARKWLFSGIAGLPLLAGVWWVPLSWLGENAPTLDGKMKAIVAAVYAALLVAVLCVSRLAWWVSDAYRARPERLPWFHWPLCGAALLVAAACYWADGHVLVDLYEGLHYGLAGAFVSSVTVCLVAALAWLGRTRSRWLVTLTTPSGPVLGSWAAVLLASAWVQLSSVGGARAERALIHAKAALTVLRHSDFDGDGYSALVGGLDCAPFNRLVGPKQFDLPNNGVDDDCSGHDARWPEPQPATSYPIPDAKGFNLLLITVDALRADRTSVFGNPRKTTPNLERLAAQGLAFERAYAQGTKTFESLPSLFTGLYLTNLPRDYGHRRVRGKKAYMYTMTGDGLTLTQLLADKGYATRGVVALGWLGALGLDRGFDKLDSTPHSTAITGKAKKYLQGTKQPFALWLHYFDPHESYDAHPEHDFGEGELDRYDGEVAYADAQIGEVLAQLEESGLADRTIVVVTADHGEEFQEHGGQFHTNKLYEELLHVPLIIKMPGLKPARVASLVELIDVVPTLCEALALQSDCASFDGQSLWAALAGKRDQGPGFRGSYSEALVKDGAPQRFSLLSDRFRFTLNLDNETVELFDVTKDAREQHNLAEQQPDTVAKLRDEMALRPYRRLAAPFTASSKSEDSTPLVRALPRVRSEALLRVAIAAIAKHPSPGSREALEQLKDRPGLGPSARRDLDAALQN